MPSLLDELGVNCYVTAAIVHYGMTYWGENRAGENACVAAEPHLVGNIWFSCFQSWIQSEVPSYSLAENQNFLFMIVHKL